MQFSSSIVPEMILKGPAHDPGPWRLYEGLQAISFFYWAFFFAMIPANEKLT